MTERPKDRSTSDEAIDRLLGPQERELLCDECFERLDEYVELQLAGRNADELVPGMRAHLEGCPACMEDHDSLRDFVRASRSDLE